MKKTNMKIITMLTLIALVSLILILTGCEKQEDKDDLNQTTNSSTDNNGSNLSNTNNTQIANPASVNCIKNGGKLNIEDTPEGQVGMCTLTDGTVCEEWAYFRGECPNPNTDSESKIKVSCDDANRPGGVCTREYMPVCGFTSDNFNKVYANKCNACSDLNVSYYIAGECTKQCAGCPLLSPPAPNWCENGTIIPSKDECGCAHATCAEKTYCTPEQKKAEICTMEYAPVCGWFNQSIKCLKYPCAITGGNKCSACADPNVEFYTQGECPTGN